MTGPEHYKEAERLLDGPNRAVYPFTDAGEEDYERDRRDNLAAAQVHATLALAAATAQVRDDKRPYADYYAPREIGDER